MAVLENTNFIKNVPNSGYQKARVMNMEKFHFNQHILLTETPILNGLYPTGTGFESGGDRRLLTNDSINRNLEEEADADHYVRKHGSRYHCRVPQGGAVFKRRRNSYKSFQYKKLNEL